MEKVGRIFRQTVEEWAERNCQGDVWYVCPQTPKFLRHCHITQQHETDKVEANQSDSGVAVLQMDFSENYTCIAQDEIQSAHLNQKQVMLYTAGSGGWQYQPHVMVTDYMQHNKTSAVVFTDQILSTMPTGVQVEITV